MSEYSVTQSPEIAAESEGSLVESGFNDLSISSDSVAVSNSSNLSILIKDSRPISGQRVGFADESKEENANSSSSINQTGRNSSTYNDPDSIKEVIPDGIRGASVPIAETHLDQYQLETFPEKTINNTQLDIPEMNRDMSRMSGNVKEPHLNDQPKSFTCITQSTPKTSPLASPNQTPSSKLDEKEYINLKVLPAAMQCVEKLLFKIKLGEKVDDPIYFIAMELAKIGATSGLEKVRSEYILKKLRDTERRELGPNLQSRRSKSTVLSHKVSVGSGLCEMPSRANSLSQF